jgi:hypothetical protein
MVHATQRILVVANETVGDKTLIDSLAHLAAVAAAEVLVVAPALNSRLAYWTSSDSTPRRAAEHRLTRCLQSFKTAGVRAEGLVGDADPLQAMQDALRLFRADEIVIATHPEERSNWLAHDIVSRAREAFGKPVLHIVVDVEHAAEYLVAA